MAIQTALIFAGLCSICLAIFYAVAVAQEAVASQRIASAVLAVTWATLLAGIFIMCIAELGG
jgi:hypothetical protein